MRKLMLVAHVSLDGYVAGIKGEFDNFSDPDESLKFVCNIIDDADTALFGRNSYELINSHWPTAAQNPNASTDTIKYSNWYNASQKIVLSTTMPSTDNNLTQIIHSNIAGEINKIKQQPGKNILIFGSPTTTHSLLEMNLIDGFYLIVYPVLFGKGISLFKERNPINKLQMKETIQLEKGIIVLHYEMN